jgi:hypothetical protein
MMENLCEFITQDGKIFRCINCNLTIEALEVQIEMPIFVCSKQKSNNPEMLCTQEQIEDRHRICSSCDFYQNNSCSKCGCSLTRDRIFNNKLSHKNEECPIGKWAKIVN